MKKLFHEIAAQKLGVSIIEFNGLKDHALCYEKNETASGVKRYFIIRVSDQHVVQEGIFRPGSIRWINNDEIELYSLPAVMSEQKSEPDKKTISIRTTPNL